MDNHRMLEIGMCIGCVNEGSQGHMKIEHKKNMPQTSSDCGNIAILLKIKFAGSNGEVKCWTGYMAQIIYYVSTSIQVIG